MNYIQKYKQAGAEKNSGVEKEYGAEKNNKPKTDFTSKNNSVSKNDFAARLKSALSSMVITAALGASLIIGVPEAKTEQHTLNTTNIAARNACQSHEATSQTRVQARSCNSDYSLDYCIDSLFRRSVAYSSLDELNIAKPKRVLCSYYNNTLPANADECLETIIAMTGPVTAKPIFLYNNKEYIQERYGTGTLVRGGYIITANHVTDIKDLYVEIMPGVIGKAEGAVKQSQSTSIKLYGKELSLETVASNPQLDYAVLQIKNCDPQIKEKGVLLGDSSKLKVGNIVYIIGNGGNQGLDVRLGCISKPDTEVDEEWGIRFGFSPIVQAGDSGGAVYAVRIPIRNQGSISSSNTATILEIQNPVNPVNPMMEYVGLIQLKSGIFSYGTGINQILLHLKNTNPQVYGEITKNATK